MARFQMNAAPWIALSVAIPIALVVAWEHKGAKQAAGTVAAENPNPIAVAPVNPAIPTPPAAWPPLQQGVSSAQATTTLTITTERDTPAFSPSDLTVKAGEVVQLEFTNASDPQYNYRHGWVLAKPGTRMDVGVAANRSGQERDWVPNSPDVLARTRVIGAGETDTIVFRAPAEPGDYPFLCPSTRHWTMMHGTLHVVQ